MREAGTVEEDEIKKFHDMAFSGEADEGFLRKEIKEACRSQEKIGGAAWERRKVLNDILKTARTLRRKLAHSNDAVVPGGMKDRLEQLLVELEALD